MKIVVMLIVRLYFQVMIITIGYFLAIVWNLRKKQMKINFITPLKMQWIKGYENIFKDCEFVKTDVPSIGDYDTRMFMWCNDDTIRFINNNKKDSRYIVFIRRYEYYSMPLEKVDWSKVDEVIMVNEYLAKGFLQRTGIKPNVIYNGVNPDEWKYKERRHGNKIALVGFVNQKKNYPLALQILTKLPQDYELHIAGGIQCNATMDYIDNLTKATKRKVYFYDQIDDIDLWLEDKNYLLSTAISEGNPNNVIEAMAKGIKPIVHNWPGSCSQFARYVFNTIDEAVAMFRDGSEYKSELYRNIIEKFHGDEQYQKVRQLVCN
jgi:glycosyltransferase involved in cell wall biosynthesis